MMSIKLLFVAFLITIASSEECGEIKIGHGLSIGGEYSEPGQWPWLATLFYKERYYCGSTIISKNHLISAAHCFREKGELQQKLSVNFYALLGHYDLANKNEVNSVKKNISQIFVHPEWDPFKVSYDADISLILLSSEIIFNDFIQPICLPSSNTEVFNVDGTVAGYGLSEASTLVHDNKPKHVKIKSVEHGVCLFQSHQLAKIGSIRMFCAGEIGRNPCRGDSGNSFMVESNSKIWTINGIVSSAVNRECHENDFVLFTAIKIYLIWIEEIVKDEHPLVCDFRWHNEFKLFECYNHGLKILEPNLKVSSIHGEVPDGNIENIETIVLNRAKILHIPDLSVANSKFPNFKRLFITACGLKDVQKDKLALLPQLTVFNVYGNQIKEFPEDVFDDLKELEMLAFVRNQIKVLPQKLLWNLPKLKELWAWDNQIEVIPSNFFKESKNIEKIYLHNNKIAKIGMMSQMPKLKLINLKENICIDKRGKNYEEIRNEKC